MGRSRVIEFEGDRKFFCRFVFIKIGLFVGVSFDKILGFEYYLVERFGNCDLVFILLFS